MSCCLPPYPKWLFGRSSLAEDWLQGESWHTLRSTRWGSLGCATSNRGGCPVPEAQLCAQAQLPAPAPAQLRTCTPQEPTSSIKTSVSAPTSCTTSSPAPTDVWHSFYPTPKNLASAKYSGSLFWKGGVCVGVWLQGLVWWQFLSSHRDEAISPCRVLLQSSRWLFSL